MIAYLDESLRSRECLYVVAAALVAPPDASEVADELHRVPAGKAPRFHWRNEGEPTRRRMLHTIRDLGLRSYAALYCTDHPRWSRRGRVQAIKCLLWTFQGHTPTIQELVIETRGAHGDAEDRKAIARAQRSGHADQKLSYRFGSPGNPLLWVPDAIAGAVSSSFADGVDTYLDWLGEAAPRVVDAEP